MLDFGRELGKAVQYFWRVRGKQKNRQGGKTGKKDAGERSSVTGGKHADGFIRLIAAIVKDAALPNVDIHVTEKRPRTLPGFYRPCNKTRPDPTSLRIAFRLPGGIQQGVGQRIRPNVGAQAESSR
ncbi:MAG: PaeR7I family type II restriction endonuclease [Gammaproteobacteria bacterium]